MHKALYATMRSLVFPDELQEKTQEMIERESKCCMWMGRCLFLDSSNEPRTNVANAISQLRLEKR